MTIAKTTGGFSQIGGDGGFGVYGGNGMFSSNNSVVIVPAAQTIINAMVPAPDQSRQIIINDLVVCLQSHNIWDELDVLYILAAHSQQASLINWKNPGTFNLTAIGSPNFTEDRGFDGALNKYLKTGYNPRSNAVKFVQNSASMFFYSRTNEEGVSGDIGATDAFDGDRSCAILPRWVDENIYWVINSATQNNESNDNSMGFFSVVRTDALNQKIYKNGTLFSSKAAASSTLVNREIYVLCINDSGNAANFSNRQNAGCGIGSGNYDQADLFECIESYMDAVGAGVVS